ncbi:MAG: HPr family phosphocarrier protein [Robiginitomaculum sp.]|nr:HPr family phosphocarrier protein [Robiginitomaculum sp.]
MSQTTHSATTIIVNDRGLHARAAAKFVAIAAGFSSDIHVCGNGERVDASSIMELLMLGCSKGKQLTIHADGEDAANALRALVALVDAGFGE